MKMFWETPRHISDIPQDRYNALQSSSNVTGMTAFLLSSAGCCLLIQCNNPPYYNINSDSPINNAKYLSHGKLYRTC